MHECIGTAGFANVILLYFWQQGQISVYADQQNTGRWANLNLMYIHIETNMERFSDTV